MDKKVVLVTGASGGIGSAISKVFSSEENYELIIAGTNKKKLINLKDKLQNDNIKILQANLSETDHFINELTKINLNVDILINNAGINRDSLLLRMSDDDLFQVINLNLISTIRLTKYLIRNMIKKRYGRVISISSIVGVTGNAGQSNYASSKAGIIAFSKSLAQEVASRRITVNTISPGYIKSPMTDNLNENIQQNILAKIPCGRFGNPEDISNVVNFLANDDANYITGSNIHVNGGMVMI